MIDCSVQCKQVLTVERQAILKVDGPLEFFYDALQGSYFLSLSLWKKSYVVIFQMKASEWYFPVVYYAAVLQ